MMASTPSVPPDLEILTPAQAAALNETPADKRSARAIRRLIRQHLIPDELTLRVGRRVYIRRAAFVRFFRGE